MRTFSRLGFIHPDAPWPLIVICLFLGLITIGNLFGAYDALVKGSPAGVAQALASALIQAIPAYGLLQLKRWALWTEIILSGICLLLGVVIFAAATEETIGYQIIGAFLVIVYGLILAYLSSRGCRSLFRSA